LDSEEELSGSGSDQESEDRVGSDSEATTLRLGQAPRAKVKAAPKKKNARKARAAKEPNETAQKDSLRTTQWEVIHEAQKRIKKTNPEMTPKAVLKQAREE